MRIGELARSVGVGVETVRYYQRTGLMPKPKRPYGGTATYGSQDFDRLMFIRRAQGLGFSLNEIKSLLALSLDDCKDVQVIASRKLALVREKIADLRRMEKALSGTLNRCRKRRPHSPCAIIETLASPGN